MKFSLTLVLDRPVDEVWAAVRTPALMRFVAAPLLSFRPRDPSTWPELWTEGPRLFSLSMFGVIPLGDQIVGIEFPDGDAVANGHAMLRDRGSSGLIRTWDHEILVKELPDGQTRYTDRVSIDAGPLTPLVWLFARLFFAHRQRRLRRISGDGFRRLGAE